MAWIVSVDQRSAVNTHCLAGFVTETYHATPGQHVHGHPLGTDRLIPLGVVDTAAEAVEVVRLLTEAAARHSVESIIQMGELIAHARKLVADRMAKADETRKGSR